MSSCRSCQAPVIWATSEAGNLVPVDVAPALAGNLVLTVAPDGKKSVRGLKKGEPFAGDRYLSHFVTCTDPKRWRKK